MALRGPRSPATRDAELEQAGPALWYALLPLGALALDVAVTASGLNSQTVWYIIRAAGIIAYVLLALTVIEGLLITNRLLAAGRPRVDLFELHSFTGLLVLAFGSFHALSLLVDNYVGFSPSQILIPFTSTYRPAAVALGIMGLYLSSAIYASFWLRRRIGYRTWRLFHYASFASFLLAGLHGIFAGADAGQVWMLAIYGLTFFIVFLLVLLRLLPAETRSNQRD